ncbi:DUF4124 domain-containing protein [Vulcaniibacterium gelatinicum]|uniref:DUF4124 domain-containing protein n=1 Tax=Vulcaniibacterium gelatinicum TaxID=2598725 RepID=UPI0011C9345F|nr:DUF4124 domain-containing protein [Vulcaniibacterium gelatinicum]
MRAVILAGGMLFAGTGQAQVLYKCMGGDGVPSYQSQPCAQGRRIEKIYDATPDTPERIEASRRAQRHAAEQAERLSRMAGTDRQPRIVYRGTRVSQAERDRAACEDAKAHREATLRAVGLARTYELLQKLDEHVRAVCKGRW